MKLFILSRRHRRRGRTICDVCGAHDAPTAKLAWATTGQDGKDVAGGLDICAGCCREGARVATEGRKPKKASS